MDKKAPIVKEAAAEEKIKEAARKVFLEKGYAATRTRDIAEASGLNLALINYYFRTKENLFHIIMKEKLQLFFQSMIQILSNQELGLDQKIDRFVDRYISVLIENQDLPIFIMSELRKNPESFLVEMGIREAFQKSGLIQQIQERLKATKGANATLHPIHFIMNITALSVFPFIGKPIFQTLGGLDQQAFNSLMEQRKQLVPLWIKQLLGA